MTTGNAPSRVQAYSVSDAKARPARVLYYYSHLHLHTGSPRALLSVVDGLDRERFAPAFLAIGDGPLVTELRSRGVEVVEGRVESVTPRRLGEAIAHVRRQMDLLESLDVDLVHIHETGWNFDLAIAAWLKRIPVVLHLHNPVIVYRQNLHWPIAKRVIFVSRAHLESAVGIERIRAKADVIYNAVALKRFANGKSIRESLGIRPDQFVVGTVAQLSERKGIDVLVESAARLIPRHPELVFLIAGPGPPVGTQDFANAMRARANDPVMDGRLRFLGPRSDVPDLLTTYDAFVLPSRAEPLGIAIIEALAAKLPVIASRVGGIPEVIDSPSIGTLVDEPTVDSVSKAIEELLRRPDRGRSLGLAGSDSLQGRFDGASIAARWNELYSGLVKRSRLK